jgi:hypothetical protein
MQNTSQKAIPIRIHPDNPKVFEFRGRPRVLVCATEHYGAVINRPFRFERYLADAAEKSQTLTRLFLLFREQQHSRNPYSTCKPESTDYISPFPRTGPGNAIDGLPKYDLDRWNPEFFERLHGFLSLASDYGIVVEVVLFSNTYNDDIWMLNPFHPENNINNTETIRWPDYTTLRHTGLVERQKAHARKMVEEINPYDNVLIEICNEPGGDVPGNDTNPTPAEVNEWLSAMEKVVRETEAGLPNRHLVVGQEAFTQRVWSQTSDLSFDDFFVEAVNIHPLPGTWHRGREYDMGTFMSNQLKLRALRDFCLATYPEKKPLNLDEDNVASRFKDARGWTVHRKRAWTALLCGAHYDYIDFSILPWMETGTPDSQKHIRTWMKHLSEFVHSVDLVRARPLPGWLKEQPESTVESVLAVEGKDYCIYLADGREWEHEDAGKPFSGTLTFDLPAGSYKTACYSPVSGLYSPWTRLEGGENVSLDLPEFEHDIVIRITA